MPVLRILAAIWAVLFAAAPPAAATPAEEPGRVVAVRAADAGGLQIVIDAERRGEPRIFTLDEPMRLVVDLGPGRWQLAQGPVAQGAIGGWRFGRGEGQAARLVVDLTTPVRVRRIAYDLGAPRGVARLVIDLEQVARAAFVADIQPWRRTSELLKDVYAPPRPVAAPQPPSEQASRRPPIAPVPAAATPAVPVTGAVAATRPAAPPPPEPRAPASQRPGPEIAAAAGPAPAVAAGRALPGGRAPGRRVVVIDPGHGGQDPGAIGSSGIYEKTITLAVAQEVRRHLEATGRYRVHLTREQDVFVALRERIALARRWKADVFVSIHADSIGSVETRGASVYTLSDTASDAEAAALAARENRADIIVGVDLSNESRDVANILIDLAQRETMNRSAEFAHLLVRELGHEIRLLPVRPHRFAGFAVLKAPDVPSVLLELGYLSNAEDERLLRQASHRRRIALGIQRAIDEFFAAPAR